MSVLIGYFKDILRIIVIVITYVDYGTTELSDRLFWHEAFQAELTYLWELHLLVRI
jgi:hypothetical protein